MMTALDILGSNLDSTVVDTQLAINPTIALLPAQGPDATMIVAQHRINGSRTNRGLDMGTAIRRAVEATSGGVAATIAVTGVTTVAKVVVDVITDLSTTKEAKCPKRSQ